VLKRICFITLAICLVIVPGGGIATGAQAGISVIRNSTDITFPHSIGFTLEAESSLDIVDIRLQYTVDRQSFAQVTSEVIFKIEPSRKVKVSWYWDFVKTGGLPPGVEINYWWLIKDESGNLEKTEKTTVFFNDDRYEWKQISQGEITLYWYDGDKSFADELMEAAQDALGKLADTTGASIREEVNIYIYEDYNALRQAMIFPQEWTGGRAYTYYDTVVIGIETNNLQWGKRAMVHELTHIVTHQMTFNPYGSIPTWLNEGLSMYAEGPLESNYVSVLKWAINTDETLSVQTLASPFSSDRQIAYLSYAQSYKIVEYLINEYGRAKMNHLLNVYKEGSGNDEALLKVYGFDVDGLNDLWQQYIRTPEAWKSRSQNFELNAAAAVIIVLVTMAMAALITWTWRRNP